MIERRENRERNRKENYYLSCIRLSTMDMRRNKSTRKRQHMLMCTYMITQKSRKGNTHHKHDDEDTTFQCSSCEQILSDDEVIGMDRFTCRSIEERNFKQFLGRYFIPKQYCCDITSIEAHNDMLC
mmetsp:Transcript_19634/g.47393  ORF Transcript_19634/g.47393 Transcript_19634/m.47393 type:complete len:126 (+) Transcript_19634:1058-1435(+)